MKVRIKTLVELRGKRPESWNEMGQMDYLFGATVDAFHNPYGSGFLVIRENDSNEMWVVKKKHIKEVIKND